MSKSEEFRDPAKLLAALTADDWAVRFNAGLDLVKLGNVHGVPALIEALEHPSQAVRNFHAGAALIGLGDKATPALVGALNATNVRVRVAAANILHQIDDGRIDELLPVAVDALDSDDPEAHSDAYALLGRMGEEAYGATSKLAVALRAPVELKDPQGWEGDPRHRITGTLARISKPLDQTISVLVESLGSADVSLRWSSVQALGMMAAKAWPAASVLNNLAKNELEDESVRVEAIYSLVKVGDETVIASALPGLLESPAPKVRSFAARIVGEPALRSRTDSNQVVEWTLPFLAKVLPLLIDAARDPDFNVRRNATLALSNIGAAAESAIPQLAAGLDDDETGPVAAEALAKIGSASVPTLVESLDHADDGVRGLAGYALKLIDTPQTEELFRDAERAGRASPFKPLVEHLLPQVPVTFHDAKLTAFESLYERTTSTGRRGEITYDLPYPKHEFLRFLVEVKGLLMHGSNNPDVDVMNPVRFSTDAGEPGNVSGVYADKDHIRPMFFAIVNRQRCFGLTNGFFDRKEDGSLVTGGEIGVHGRFYFLSIDHKGLQRDPWCDGTVYVLPPETFTFWRGQYTSRVSVEPLMKIAVKPDDHPLLPEIWGYEYYGAIRKVSHPGTTDPFPFLNDVDAFPIRTTGKSIASWRTWVSSRDA